MPEAKLEQTAAGIRVESGGWRIEHTAASGGAWTFAAPLANPERNLLAAPLSSAIHCIGAASNGTIVEFRECLDTKAKLTIETVAGISTVVAEGVFRNERGETQPVGFRRRTEYHPFGIAWTTIEFMSDCGCPGVVAVSAMQADLRAGMSDCHATLHPSQGGTPELLGTSGKFSLAAPVAFQSRFTPIMLNCVDGWNEGIEFIPGGDLAAWDLACKPQPGLGRYSAERRDSGARLELMPYCMTDSRTPVTLQGKMALRMGIALPSSAKHVGLNTSSYLTDGKKQGIAPKNYAVHTNAASIAARSGQNIYIHVRTEPACGESFWRAGQIPPYDAEHKAELREVVESAHANGLKAIISIPLRGYHPSAPEFARNAPAWMHMAAPSLGPIHELRDRKPAEALMCLNSGWSEHLERTINHVLSDLPWDGVYFNDARPIPCCHPGHSRGPFHSDIEGLLRILSFCRDRTSVFVPKLSTARRLAAENFADGA